MEIAVALGGGGARGVAHLGVLEGLLERGFSIGALTGTSIGGLVGALFACGYTPGELKARFMALDQRRLFGQRRGDMPSLLGIAGLAEVLEELLGGTTFDDLALPLAVTAVDVRCHQPVILRRGRLLDAVLATIALPGIFPPRPWEGERLLVDGGLINPVPVDVARTLAPSLPVVAVPLSAVSDVAVELHGSGHLYPIRGMELIGRLRVGQALETFLTGWEVSSRLLTQLRLDIDGPDAVVTPRVDDVHVLGEVDVEDVYARGVQAVGRAGEELERLTTLRARLARAMKMGRTRPRAWIGGEN
jgi:NTE family protein